MITHPLYDCVHAGDVEGVRAWLDPRIEDLNQDIGDGYAPLHVSCMFGHEALCRFLVERGALINLNAVNASGATPLHLAVSHRDEAIAAKIADFLIRHGAELNAPQKGGQTALHHAVARGSAKLVGVLIDAGADPFLKDAHGRAPVDLARALELDEVRNVILDKLKAVFSPDMDD